MVVIGGRVSLTYCVSASFGANCDLVVRAMAIAVGAWEKSANVKLSHVTAQDAEVRRSEAESPWHAVCNSPRHQHECRV